MSKFSGKENIIRYRSHIKAWQSSSIQVDRLIQAILYLKSTFYSSNQPEHSQ